MKGNSVAAIYLYVLFQHLELSELSSQCHEPLAERTLNAIVSDVTKSLVPRRSQSLWGAGHRRLKTAYDSAIFQIHVALRSAL
jgi:hypothetical protein